MTYLKKISCLSAIAGLFLVLTPGTASAQPVQESKTDDGFAYAFDDDPLSAGGFGPNDSRIRVRRGAQRSTLIKPRTQFITELLKSVENL